jgi:hypothetical protein
VLREAFIEIPESAFRVDISSTEIRAQKGASAYAPQAASAERLQASWTQ